MIDFRQILNDRHWELANEFDNLTEDNPGGPALLARLAELDDLMGIVEACGSAESARKVVRGAGLHAVADGM